jgi:hypothetical protein
MSARKLRLQGSALREGQSIPPKHTCEDVSPHLEVAAGPMHRRWSSTRP